MKALLIILVGMLVGCVAPVETADRAVAYLSSGEMKRRYDLLGPDVEVAVSSEHMRAPAGARLPLLITITNRSDRPTWIPAAFGGYFELCGHNSGGIPPVTLDGMPPNDLVYARELRPGGVASEIVEFELPTDARGAFQIYVANYASRSFRLTVDAL